jgi:hypothetical protein
MHHVSERMQKFLDGEIAIEDLTNEEITRGQLMSKDGDFKGRPSDMIPRKFYDAVVRETIKRTNEKFREEIEPSIRVLAQIRDNPRAHADARYKSAVYLLERSLGKVPEKTEMKVEVAKWEQDIHELVYDDEAPQG